MAKLSSLDENEQIALHVALGEYLDKFEDQRIAYAHPQSNIGISVQLYNRIKNIRHGVEEEYQLDRHPFHRLNGGKL